VSEFTLGGYMEIHERAAAFAGSDGRAYSVDILVEDVPDERGQYGAALLFIRWALDGSLPDGHLETGLLVRGRTPDDARERIGALSLYDVKAALDELISAGRPEDF
jgi:hypothetical protein